MYDSLTGGLALETAKSFMRCGCFGSKYVFRTVPRFLTIWLDYGEMMKKPESGITGTDQFRSHTVKQRQMNLRAFHAGLEKYVWRYPRYIVSNVIVRDWESDSNQTGRCTLLSPR